MNERIKELAEQAGLGDNKFNEAGIISVYGNFDLEKFAELIVRECVSKIGDEYKDALDDVMEDWDRGYLGGLSCAIDKIKEHFGVEE